MDVVTGCKVEAGIGEIIRIYEQRCKVVAQLEPTGTGLDTAVYCNMDTMKILLAAAEEKGELYIPARQVFLTVTCGLNMSDEEFIAAVCDLLRFSDGSEIVTPEPSHLPAFGEKGAA